MGTILGHFFSIHGRISRLSYVFSSLLVLLVCFADFILIQALFGTKATIVIYPVMYWSLLVISIKRYHDADKSGMRLFLLALPILGLVVVMLELCFRQGTHGENKFGPEPRLFGLDYLRVPDASTKETPNRINDVTRLNPIHVAAITVPTTVEEAQLAIQRSKGPVSVGGGRFSMGGQTASPNSLHIDMRQLNGVVSLNPIEKTIRVHAGIRWCDIQKVIDAHDLSIQIMQTYANFTVGGSLSVNCHGRYVGLGPVILSVRAIKIILADGEIVEATPTENSEIFYGAIGGYGGLGLIVEVELQLTDNVRMEQTQEKMPITEYLDHFRQKVRTSSNAIFHNADLYPPDYTRVRAATWSKTEKYVTTPHRLMQLRRSHLMWKYLFWTTSETPLGTWRREYIFEPIFYLSQRVHWRNYEAGFDVAELEPSSRKKKTYVLQEYFVPYEKVEEFTQTMGDIYRRYGVNVLNVSLRHAIADPGSLLAWGREEMFAFVVYYKQGVTEPDKMKVAIWTRELIDAVTDIGGTYYLPYQPHATLEQFKKAYPRYEEYFALKKKLDPEFRFRNTLIDKYYTSYHEGDTATADKVTTDSEFHKIYFDTRWRDKFYAFYQNVFRLYPEDKYHHLVMEACKLHDNDEAIYRHIVEELPSISPFLSPLTYALPSLKKQKQVMTGQVLEIMGDNRKLHGLVEIGSTGRYVSDLQKHVEIEGEIYIVNTFEPTNSPVDMMERGGIAKIGQFVQLDDFAPISKEAIPDNSVDMVTCFIGLHHTLDAKMKPFLASIHRVLRPGGLFVVRDHDAHSPEMITFCSLVHTVFNTGVGEPWSVTENEVREFRSAEGWVEVIENADFTDQGFRILQDHDPSLNTLMAFQVNKSPESGVRGPGSDEETEESPGSGVRGPKSDEETEDGGQSGALAPGSKPADTTKSKPADVPDEAKTDDMKEGKSDADA